MQVQKIVVTIVLFFFSVSVSLSQTKDSLNIVDKQGKKQGKWVVFDKYERKLSEGTYKDGYRMGDFVYFFQNGNTKSIIHYYNKGKDAKYKSYYENGTMQIEGAYKNEKRDSLWFFYNNSGEIIAKENYKLGKKEGTSEVYNNEKVQESLVWKNDEKNGKWFREKIKGGYLIGYYKENKLEGAYEEHADGGALQVKGQYIDNLQTGEWQYFDSEQQLEKIEHWKEGQLIKCQVILKTPQQENITLFADSIAYFYNKGRVMYVKTTTGETFQVQNTAQHFIEVVGEISFMIINYEMGFYAHYNAVRSIALNPENDKWQVTVSPVADFDVFADKESARGLRIYFGQDE